MKRDGNDKVRMNGGIATEAAFGGTFLTICTAMDPLGLGWDK